MSEKFVRLNPKFTVTDADNPEIYLFDGNLLRIKFLDYRESLVELEFSEVIGFKWSIEELDYPELSDDSVYEVVNSQWIEKYRKIGEPISAHKHYKLCFNACGILDVIFKKIEIIKSPEI